MDDRSQILNLLYRFALHFDLGDFDAAVALFKHGKFLVGNDRLLSSEDMKAVWLDILILYDGSPRTKHVITNSIVDIEENCLQARCQSYYTVFQRPPQQQLQPVICGRYDDQFTKVDGLWQFRQRDYGHMDIIGDLSGHLKPGKISTPT